MSALDDILNKLANYYYNSGARLDGGMPKLSQEEANQQIKDLFKELVGEDETFVKDIAGAPKTVADSIVETRNWLRAELRKGMDSL